jgi:hypothetical protein
VAVAAPLARTAEKRMRDAVSNIETGMSHVGGDARNWGRSLVAQGKDLVLDSHGIVVDVVHGGIRTFGANVENLIAHQVSDGKRRLMQRCKP